jgi:nanoRNase/pAp phosphatase (c-di-AMP/oligoRNAs hydrolase)
MTITNEIQKKIETVIKKIESSKKILVVSDSSMVDEDCIYSGLALRWLFEKMGKEVDNVVFSRINETFAKKKDVNLVQSKFVEEVDFHAYDAIFLVDSPQWGRILTSKAEEVLLLHGKDNFVLFDHHIPEDIDADIGDRSINYPSSSTGLLIYETLFKALNITPDLTCAEYIYRTVISDTQCLRVNSNADTFAFCAEAQKWGIDHQKIVEELSEVSKDAVDFFTYCLSKTEYYPSIKCTVLYQDQAFEDYCNSVFGDTWRQVEMLSMYKENFMRRVEGFEHGLIFWVPYDKTKTKVSWRSKEYITFDLAGMLNSIGFKLGGHKNAGGGVVQIDIEQLKKIVSDYAA